MKSHASLVLLSAMVCAACSHSPVGWHLGRDQSQTLSDLTVCRNYGCSERVSVSLSETEWASVRALFLPAAPHAAQERERVREAIARIETLVGPKAGTANDRAGADIVTLDREGQLDCIDEAHNTSVYLRLLAAEGLLLRHEVGEPVQRGHVLGRWPHNTATLAERETGTIYTVDSWFHANGALPETVLLQDWLDGWSPPQA